MSWTGVIMACLLSVAPQKQDCNIDKSMWSMKSPPGIFTTKEKCDEDSRSIILNYVISHVQLPDDTGITWSCTEEKNEVPSVNNGTDPKDFLNNR